MTSASTLIQVPGEECQPNEDRELAVAAGRMTARVLVEDLKRGMLPHTQAFERLSMGMDLFRPSYNGGGASAFFEMLSRDFAMGFVNELARRCA